MTSSHLTFPGLLLDVMRRKTDTLTAVGDGTGSTNTIVSTGVTTGIRTCTGTTLYITAIITITTDAVSTPYSFSSTCTITTTTNLTTVTASATTTTTLWRMPPPRECSASVVPMLRVSDAVVDFRSVLFLDTYCDLRGPPRHTRRKNSPFAWR